MHLRKKLIPLGLCLGFSSGLSISAFAQIVPPVPVPAETPTETAPASGRPLRQLLVGESIEELQKMAPQPGAGIVVLSPAFAGFDAAELTKRLSAGENQIIDARLLAAATQVIENFVRQSDYPNAAAIIPTLIAAAAFRLL